LHDVRNGNGYLHINKSI